MIGLGTKFIIRVVLNGLGLYAARLYLPGFFLEGGLSALLVSAVVLAILYSVIRPILRVITAPILWLSLGLFNIVINMGLLWTADQLLSELAIKDLLTLFLLSLIIAIANIF